jgi:hypothetical protein
MLGFSNKKGLSVMSLLILIILIIGVGIPLTDQVITDANLTGLTATVVEFIPTFLALLVLVATARNME